LALDGLPTNVIAIFLIKEHPGNVALDDIQRVANSLDCELLDAVELAYPAWPGAVVIGHGVPQPASAPRARRQLRIASAASGANADTANSWAGQAQQNRHRQAEEHAREREERLALERQLRRLRKSASLRLGAALVGIARKPSSAVALPLQVVEIYRSRRRRGGAASVAAVNTDDRSAQLTTAKAGSSPVKIDESHQFLAGFDGASDQPGALEIFGVVTDPVAGALSDHAALSRVLPHDATLALELRTPDLILVQAGALLPPGPWAHAGTPGGAVAYTQILHDLFVMAQNRGVPVVVWQDVLPSLVPALGPLGRLANLLLSGGQVPAGSARWSPGVPLAHFHPVVKTVTDRVLVFDPGAGPVAAPSTVRLRHELDQAGLTTVRSASAPDLSDLVRGHAVVLASPFDGPKGQSISDFTLAALAAGARVVTGRNDTVLAGFPSAVFPIVDASEATKRIQAVLSLPELPMADRRRNLRRVFTADATPVKLAWLAGQLGLKQDPLADRQVAALIQATETDQLIRALDGLLRQSARPGRLVISAPAIPDRALDEVAALGMAASVLPPDQSLSSMAQLAGAPWVTVWDDTGRAAPANLLEDLGAAAEWSGADVVGIFDDDHANAPFSRDVTSLPLLRSLTRRDVLVRRGPDHGEHVQTDHGPRLVGVNYTGAAQ
jgi:hypothetical protein